MTVLLAEQDPWVRLTLRSMLGRAGFEVVDAAASPARSLPEAAGHPAVLVADTGHGGKPALRHLLLEARRQWPQIRVVLTSTGAANPDEVALADHFLPKPFSGKALIRVVKELTEQRAEPGPPPTCAHLSHPAREWLS